MMSSGTGRYMAFPPSPSPSAPPSPHLSSLRSTALVEQDKYLTELLGERHKLSPFMAVLPHSYRLLNQARKEMWNMRIDVVVRRMLHSRQPGQYLKPHCWNPPHDPCLPFPLLACELHAPSSQPLFGFVLVPFYSSAGPNFWQGGAITLELFYTVLWRRKPYSCYA
ncbi:hypothetical protein VNO77_25726 [Canavalia gladiata]|uniref:Uncharacterized protein n=1 Tax=Canavalia gladiata TaxID=3824 RepID=A0AAN9KRA4_CANGL